MLGLAFGPALLLDEDLCFRRFTPKVAEDFNLIPADFGGCIDGFVDPIPCDDLQSKIANALSAQNALSEKFGIRRATNS